MVTWTPAFSRREVRPGKTLNCHGVNMRDHAVRAQVGEGESLMQNPEIGLAE